MAGYIVGVGGAAMDVIARCESAAAAGDKNPARISTNPGGVTRNICENLARLGEDVKLLAVLGDDSFGREICSLSAAAGMDMSHVRMIRELRTPCYVAMLNADGDMVTAASDFAAAAALNGEYFGQERELLTRADAIVTDGNLTAEQLEALLDAAGPVPVYIDPVSEAKAVRLKGMLGRFAAVKPNLRELELLSDRKCKTDADILEACQVLLDRGCGTVITSLGVRGCACADQEGARLFRKLPGEAKMRNATGAGDAFLAGFLSGKLRGLELTACLDRALAAGYLAVESAETINPDMSNEAIQALLDGFPSI